METSTGSKASPYGRIAALLTAPPPQVLNAPTLPDPLPEEADVFARHQGVPGHRQDALARARILSVGGGGLMGIQCLSLIRSGVRWLCITDPDRVERHNLPRQLFTGSDIGEWKAVALARNLLAHSTNAAAITAIALPVQAALEQHQVPADLIMCGVDSNRCRLDVARYARERGVNAVFTMLSRDGMRSQAFLQSPYPTDACLLCALPDLNPDIAAPCAAATITSCLLAGAHGVFFAYRALMGWPPGAEPFNWREGDLLGIVQDRTGIVAQRADCSLCHER